MPNPNLTPFTLEGAHPLIHPPSSKYSQEGLARQIGTTPAQLLADIAAVSEGAVRSLSNC